MRFKKFYIEITNVCNLACSFCPKTMRAPKYMSLETFSKILDGIGGYTKHIYFHVKGEPLLHPDIDKFLDLSHLKGLKVNITTNGTLINKVKGKLLGKPALRQINLSLHSLDKNDTCLNMEDYLNNIFEFTHEAIGRTDTIIAFRLWNLDEDNFVNIGREKNRHILERIEREFDLRFKIEEKVASERGIRISDKIYLNFDSEFKWPNVYEEHETITGFCYGLRNQIAVLVDGTVVPCCLDGNGIINLGNINESPLKDILESKRARDMYDGFSNRQVVEELCRKCGYRRKFNV